jgi:hypothetical protein
MADPEILVHIAAPSTSKDDARYRAQVDAILAFQPVSRQPIFSIDDEEVGDQSAIAQVASEQVPADEERATSGDELASVLRGHELSPVSRDAAPSRGTANQDVNRSEDVTHVSSTHLQLDSTASVDGSDQTSPRCVTRAVNAKSRTGPRAAVDRANTAPADQRPTYTALPVSSPSVRRSYSDSASLEAPLSVIPDSQPTAIDEWYLADQAPSEHVQVERSFITKNEPPFKRRRLDNNAEEEKDDSDSHSRIPSSLPSPPRPSVLYRSPTPAESTQKTRKNGLRPPKQSTNAKDSPKPSKIRPTPVFLPAAKHDISLAKLPLEIHPPPPSASGTAKFQTHITPTLAMLAERMKWTSKFCPARQSRDLQALERGYWLVRMTTISELEGDQCSSSKRSSSAAAAAATPTDWSFPFFCQFWSFLTEFLREGRAGWGVWCILSRDEEDSTNGDAGADADADVDAGRKPSMLTMKVYSWGEVVPHVYMLLYLATERRIRGMKAQWRDAGEKIVIEMP